MRLRSDKHYHRLLPEKCDDGRLDSEWLIARPTIMSALLTYATIKCDLVWECHKTDCYRQHYDETVRCEGFIIRLFDDKTNENCENILKKQETPIVIIIISISIVDLLKISFCFCFNIQRRTIHLAKDNICNAFRAVRICRRWFPAEIKGTCVFLD